ncbi:conserved hypothetical protein [Burkholderia cenocepacia]|uniref:hypothetical protein n=1 Tax=Burkholderia cenocepacia TaxID=95486 RepID=UPI00192A8F2F|nr:hypothetical protein [Burkholderia cenocepacia]CAD9228011.1 conserved hypothetical protein [Burkholderia cenocepacia]
MSDLKIIELSTEALSQFKGLKIKSRRKLIESVLDFWERELFPVLEEQEIPKYEFVCTNILHRAGYEDITPETVRQKVYQIHKSRRRKGLEAVSNPPEQAHRPITTPIAMKEPVAPLVTSQAPARPVSLPGGVAEPVVVDWQWKEERDRLEAEPMDALWTEQDKRLWSYFAQSARKLHIDIDSNYHTFYRTVNGITKEVLMKLNSKRKDLLKEGFLL